MKILITGANGFLGSTIVRQAQVSKISFRATDLHMEPVTLGVDYKRSDVTNYSTLKPVMNGITCVVHAAGLAHVFDHFQTHNTHFDSVNVMGTTNVANAAISAGVQHFVLISSVSVYGPFTQGVYDEDVPCSPVGPYALSKHMAEKKAQEIATKSGMALTILRLSTLYGEGDPGNICRLMNAIDRGRFIWVGNGKNKKSLLYKEDAARACIAVLCQPTSGVNVYNVSAPPCTMREIVDSIAFFLGKHLLPVSIPAPLALFLSGIKSKLLGSREAELYHTIQKWLSDDIYSSNRFNRIYCFQTKTGLKDGLQREVNWYQCVKKNK